MAVMPARLFAWLRRGFDFVCTTAGLALLVVLGPWMLLTAVNCRVPEVHELLRVSGITTGCRPVFGGVKLLLEDYENEFLAQLDSCTQAQVELSHHAHVTMNVMPDELRQHAPIHSFGFEVGDRVVHTIDSDRRTARVDRAIVTATGVGGSVVLLWLGWAVGTNRGALGRLLIGASADAAPRSADLK
jgi:hypothetical protein